MAYKAENRIKTVPHREHAGDRAGKLVSVISGVNASFVHDGDGNRTKDVQVARTKDVPPENTAAPAALG